MRLVLIAVEGQTEERFVKDVLAPHLQLRGIRIVPTILRTKIVRQGGPFKGGLTSFRQIDERVTCLLRDSHAVLVTTMFDYYGRWRNDFLTNYRSEKTPAGATARERVQSVEREMEIYFDHPRFRAFLVLHEFEALLFSSPAEIAAAVNQPETAKQLEQIRQTFPTPEEIDDQPQSAPSKRLLTVIEGYQKPAHGALIASRIGIERIRGQCPHFAEWLSTLEALTSL